jgi:hypothetical protein
VEKPCIADRIVGARGVAASSLLPVEGPGREVGVVSAKTSASAAVPSLQSLRRAQMASAGPPERAPAARNAPGFPRGRNAGDKLEIPAYKKLVFGGAIRIA